jgi:hypothetical protein
MCWKIQQGFHLTEVLCRAGAGPIRSIRSGDVPLLLEAGLEAPLMFFNLGLAMTADVEVELGTGGMAARFVYDPEVAIGACK